MERFRQWFSRWLQGTTALTFTTDEPSMKVSAIAVARARATGQDPVSPWEVAVPMPGVVPKSLPAKMAMDWSGGQAAIGDIYRWASAGTWSEGLRFLTYPYLAELAQRAEYRRMSEIIAEHAVRKWVTLKGADETKLKELRDEMVRRNIRGAFQEVAEHDGLFGRGQLYINPKGDKDVSDPELEKPLLVSTAKFPKDSPVTFKPIEPIWSYPGAYESANPLAAGFYRPQTWFVNGKIVHESRMLTFVGREVPDLLKPAYQFGGLSLSQMAKPYIDNWLRTRQSVSDLVNAFSQMVLATEMGSTLQGDGGQDLINRVAMFNAYRSNRGTMVINKDSEELTNVTTPLSGLADLQEQAQEQMASVCGIPLVILLGVTPSGLNASSDGEVRTFYANIKAYQESTFRNPLATVIAILQLSLWGAIDPAIEFEFNDLWEMDAVQAAAIRKSDAEVGVAYVNCGVLSPAEERERIAEDPSGSYHNVDLSQEPPERAPFDDGQDDEDDTRSPANA